jgi:hypothetical protein
VTWSSQPYITTPLGTWENDMDAHMWLDVGGLVTHLYSGSGDGTNNCSAFPNMCLKVDRRLGSGPETIDVSQLEVEGHYYFGVFNVNQVYDLVNYPTLRDLECAPGAGCVLVCVPDGSVWRSDNHELPDWISRRRSPDLSPSPLGKRKPGQATRRHPEFPPYCCFLSDLTGFAGFCRAGPARACIRIPQSK